MAPNVAPPVLCPHCGFVFRSQVIEFVPGTRNAGLFGLGEVCPHCGGRAELPEGRFNILDDTIEVLSATPLTYARLSALA